jgi:hypothetical protein
MLLVIADTYTNTTFVCIAGKTKAQLLSTANTAAAAAIDLDDDSGDVVDTDNDIEATTMPLCDTPIRAAKTRMSPG